MPLQNRVDPWGQLNAVPARGAWLGNRGILHDGAKRIKAPWRHKAWVTCKLEFKGRHRSVFAPGHYSELFFLDEATAFAAGHRPCAECRRERYGEFKALWCSINLGGVEATALPVSRIDKQLHAERALRGGGKATFRTPLKNVPDGAFIGHGGGACLVWRGALHRWSAGGYVMTETLPPPARTVTVLTPASVTALFRSGLEPQVDEFVRS